MIAAVVVVATGAALGLSMTQKPRYEASSQVLISRTNLGNVLTGTPDPTAQEFDFNRIIQTQANLARVPRVAQRTLQVDRRDRPHAAGLPRQLAGHDRSEHGHPHA